MAVDQKTADQELVDQKIEEIKTKYITPDNQYTYKTESYPDDLNIAITELYKICKDLTALKKFRSIAKEIDIHHGRTKSLLSCTILKNVRVKLGKARKTEIEKLLLPHPQAVLEQLTELCLDSFKYAMARTGSIEDTVRKDNVVKRMYNITRYYSLKISKNDEHIWKEICETPPRYYNEIIAKKNIYLEKMTFEDLLKMEGYPTVRDGWLNIAKTSGCTHLEALFKDTKEPEKYSKEFALIIEQHLIDKEDAKVQKELQALQIDPVKREIKEEQAEDTEKEIKEEKDGDNEGKNEEENAGAEAKEEKPEI